MNHRNSLSLFEQEKNFLSPAERDFYLKILFSWDSNQINSDFLYPWNAENYEQVKNSPHYSPYYAEKELLLKYKLLLKQYLRKRVIDYGCWDGEKAAIIFEGLDLNTQYIAADYSYAIIQKAKERLAKIPYIQTDEHILLDGNNFTLGKEINDATYLWLGETMSNYADAQIVEKFQQMGNDAWIKGNHFYFSFATPTPTSLEKRKAIYDNAEGKTFRMQGIRNLGLDPEDFEEEIRCDKQGNITIGLLPKKDQMLTLASGDMLHLYAQTFYPFHQNRVFSRQEVEMLLKKAGAHAVFFAEEEGVGLVVAKKVPERFQKHKAKVQKALLGVLLIGAGMGLKTWMDIKKHHQEFDRVQKELVKWKTLENYGFWTSEQTITFQEGEAILRQTTQQLAWALYQELSHWFDLQNVHDSEKIQLLIQAQLLRKKEDGQYYNLSQLQSQHSSEKTEFLSSFVREFRVILGSYGMNERIAQGISAFEPTLTLPGEIRGIFSDLSTPATAPKFRANLENTTPFAQNPFLSSDPKSIALQENFDAGVFDYIQTIGNYKTSDGKVYKLILIDKKMTLPSGEILKGPFLLAAESSDPKRASQAAQKYALSLGQKVIKDYLQHWSSPRE